MTKKGIPIKDYYVTQAIQGGGNLPAFHGASAQRGYGLGSMLKGLFRWALPRVQAGVKSLGRQALKGGLAVAQDVADGQDLKTSLKKRAQETGKNLMKNVISRSQTGSGRRGTKRRARKKPTTSNKTKKVKTSPKQEFELFLK